MSYCLNPDCPKPENPEDSKFCQKCGEKLLLWERYRALQKIGQGGFGKTFKAIDERKPSHPPCVIKQFSPRDQGTENLKKAKELFRQEAEQLDVLGKHPQIPELLAYSDSEQEGRLYLVQEFIAGQDLSRLLHRQKRFSETQVRRILEALLSILRFVHGNNVIHRDIKPENIIYRPKDRQFFLVDFGAAKVATATALGSVPGTTIGDPRYIAPEQAVGRPDYASDIYSLGVTCVHLLTGKPTSVLFDHYSDIWVWRDHLGDNAVSDDLANLLDRAIAKATGERYNSIVEVIADYKKLSPPATYNFETIQLDSTGKVVQRQNRQTQRLIEDLGNNIALEMIAIPGGNFLMGSSPSEKEHLSNESPQHSVAVAPFLMAKTPVTQAQWQAVSTFPQVKIPLNPSPSKFGGAQHPVEQINWYEAVEFCDRLAQKTGKDYRLPSEAEWEYACRAGTKTPFHFGEVITPHFVNYNHQQTTEVGSFPFANGFGLYDMHGLVWEWCADPWHADYQGARKDGQVWLSSADLTFRIIRGGAWGFPPSSCRCAYRSWSIPDCRFNFIGLRVVISY